TIDAIGTDHAPHPAERKNQPWDKAAFGMTAIETALPVVADVLTAGSRTDWRRLVEVMVTGPAAIGGLDRPGIEVGAPADLCVVAAVPEYRIDVRSHRSRSANSP